MKVYDWIIINAPPKLIFSALLNPAMKRRWNNQLVASNFEYDKLIGGKSASLKFTEVYKEGNHYKKYQTELLQVFKAEQFSYKYAQENFDVIVEYNLVEAENCTQVKRSTEIVCKSWFAKLTANAISRTNRKQVVEELNNLKNYVENRLLFFI